MTAAAVPTSAAREGFSPGVVLALILVSVVAFAGLAVLGAYAPELRGASDPGAHALSSSAIGFRGATVMLRAEGAPVVFSRAPPKGRPHEGLTVLTPTIATTPQDLAPFLVGGRRLIVLSKWLVTRQPLHPGFVEKVGVIQNGRDATMLLRALAPRTEIWLRKGESRPALRGTGHLFGEGTYLPLGRIDRLQTLAGDGWIPALVDEQGRAVLAQSKSHPEVYVLADPDLLNNQGVANLDTARAGLAILDAGRGPDEGVVFDVTLAGISRGQGIGRTLLEPPWLAATLCGVATAILMGLHALARFGPTQRRGRVFALGKRALVDSSAGLVRMAGREAELAPAYAALTKDLIARRAGGAMRQPGEDLERWLADLARLRAAAPPAELTAEAARATTRESLLAVGRRLYAWRLEMTRERR